MESNVEHEVTAQPALRLLVTNLKIFREKYEKTVLFFRDIHFYFQF